MKKPGPLIKVRWKDSPPVYVGHSLGQARMAMMYWIQVFKRQHAAKRSAQTRREYAWECCLIDSGLISEYSLKWWPLAHLDAISMKIIDAECPKRKWHPTYWRQNTGTSQCYGVGDIFMHPGQYCYAVLLHELVHSMGYRWHTPGFVRKYIYLLTKYGRCNEGPLIISAGLFKVI
jgi:hypothetical protein